MTKRKAVFAALLMVALSLSGCLGRGGGKGDGDGGMGSPEEVDSEDYNVLYIGHSFGRKFAESLEDYAHTAGETSHAQYIEFSGGESGSPGLLWEDAEHQSNIKAFLDTGEIDVLVMICCSPEFIQTLDTDQAIWNFTDYAVEKIQTYASVWPCRGKISQENTRTQASMRQTQHSILMPYWENLSDELSADYPETEVFTFHHGALAYEMREMFEAGDLDEDIERLQGPKATSLFTDEKAMREIFSSILER